ncbi:ABC transporter permease [Parageobacillus thermoglucosidasius]|uniref:ABC transporter permease n=1 Tax=Parageobacillus thermoglucosidasius TaxID=1426 RepID=UPI0027FB39BD|nr:ABC transporter permease [Parageobacillus thermoglucosidasius]
MQIRWIRFLVMKILRLASLLIAVSVISFWLVSLSPVDPIQAYIGADMLRVGTEQRQAIASYWGLDLPPMERFIRWAAALLHGDLGTSMIYRQPVAEVIHERFSNSFWLMASSWILSGIIGFVSGVIAAMKKDTWVDKMITWYCYTLVSTPTFWIGLMLLIIFSVWLGWLPVGLGVPAGVLAEQVTIEDRLRHMVLPMLTLSIVGIAPIALHTRQKLIDVLTSEYVRFAIARGEQGLGLVLRHGLRNIALPAISLQFASFSELFGGAVLAEQVFSYPGLGQATVEAGLRGDVPLLLGLVLFSTLFVFIGNGLADFLYQIVDPRLRGGGKA